MATWYSRHYILDTTAAQTALPDPRVATKAGMKHARKRVNVCQVDQSADGIAEADVVRFCTMYSSDRLLSLSLSTDGSHAVGQDIDLGLHLTGENNDGAVLDADLFGASFDLGAALTDVDAMLTGALSSHHRGQALWELYTVGAGNLTEDPLTQYDITGTIDTVGAGTGGYINLIVEYLHGA
jgi:hypothetical protein